MADGFACKPTPPREVLWPESIILTAHSFIRVCLFIPNPRAGWLSQLKHAWNKFHGFLGNLENSDQNAHWAGGLTIAFC